MRLEGLHVEHYGIFSDTRFEFSGDGFQLIFGPNEAGKSTLLQLIREVLFGFPARTPFAFADHPGELAASATLQLADGTRIEYRRRKGRKQEVVGRSEPAGHRIDAAALSRLLGGASLELYEQVFGFSLSELASGERGLQQANLNEALYGGGLGGLANFQQVVGDLQEEAAGLFTPRSSTRTINALLKRIKATETEQRKLMVRPSEYKRQVDAATQLGRRVAELADQRDELQARETHLQRITAALPCWLEITAARRELADLAVPPGFPAGGGRRLVELQHRREERALELEELEREAARHRKELADLQQAPEILAHEAAIRRLGQKVSQIESFREDIPKRQQEADDQRARVRTMLRELNPAWDESHLDRFASSLEQRDLIERLQHERDRLDRRRTELAAGLAALARDVQRLTQQRDGLQASRVPDGLAELLDAEAGYRSDCKKRQELAGQLDELQAEIELHADKLRGPLDRDPQLNRQLPVPMERTILEHRERLAAARETVRQETAELQRVARDADRLREQLRQLDARERVPDREQLRELRDRRDAGWSIIRRSYLESEPVSQEEIDRWLGREPASLADAYERAVEDADRLADRRQDKATLVAHREQLLAEARRQEERVASLQQQLARSRGEESQLVEAWNRLWEPCSFRPLSPDAMLDWRRDYDDLVDRQQLATRTRQQLDRLSPRLERFETQLRNAFDDSAESIDRLFKRGRETIAENRDLQTQRTTLDEQLDEKRHDLRLTEKQRDDLTAEEGEWQIRWERALEQFQFPATWDVHLATRILNELTAARGQYEQALELEKRLADMQEGLEGFRSQVEALCRQLAADLLELPPETAVLQLNERLDAARQAQRDQVKLQRDLARTSSTMDARRAQMQELSRKLAALVGQAGVESEEAFLQVASKAERQEQLLRMIGDAERALQVHRSTEDPKQFQAALEDADADAIAAERRRLRERIEIVQQNHAEALKECILANQALDELQTESRAAGLAVDLESARSEFAAAVDRWAPLVLAQVLMKRAIERFEREHQPAMLGEVQRLFQQLTLGRYVGIERKLDEKGTLLVLTPEGRAKEPGALSTGTREQLYLAIRLAYILHYCRDAEPLPIVMDDVLVNFDDQRAVQTLRGLQEIAADVQILFLTCHQHLLDLARTVRPDLPVTMLSTAR